MQATKNCMDAGKVAGMSHFILLSAICVQKPLLEFQRAKLKFESDLAANDGITHSIVRPTAFFKSLAGQVESVKKGGPYVMFGDGHLAACKPISEEDLAAFMAECVTDPAKQNKVCRTLSCYSSMACEWTMGLAPACLHSHMAAANVCRTCVAMHRLKAAVAFPFS